MQVVKSTNAQNLGLGESLGIIQSDISNSRYPNALINTGLSQDAVAENPLENFDWAFAKKELENEENLDLLNILRTLREPITSLYDDSNLSLLHHSVLKGVEGKTELLIEFAKEDKMVDKRALDEWINAKTNGEGWTALHYASF